MMMIQASFCALLRTVGRRVMMGMLASLLMAMAACTSHQQPITYYAPEPSLEIKISGAGGPPNQAQLFLSQYDMRMMVVAQPSYNPARLWLNIHLPQGQTLRITGDHFILSSTEDADLVRHEKIAYIRATRDQNGETITEEAHVGQLIQGQSTETITRFLGKHTTIPRHVEVVSYIDGNLPHMFNLQLPEMEISGEKVQLPVITFTRSQGMYNVPQDWNHYPW